MSRDEIPQYDTSVAHSARVYNYWLGGKDNFAADRQAAEAALAIRPRISFCSVLAAGYHLPTLEDAKNDVPKFDASDQVKLSGESKTPTEAS